VTELEYKKAFSLAAALRLKPERDKLLRAELGTDVYDMLRDRIADEHVDLTALKRIEGILSLSEAHKRRHQITERLAMLTDVLGDELAKALLARVRTSVIDESAPEKT
jgi:hypothetical protein